jgi:hypothetical protein
MTLVEAAYPASADGTASELPAYMQAIALLLLVLGLLSLVSFSIAWRRSLGLADEERGVGSWLTIDTRTFNYLVVRLGFSSTHGSKTVPRSRSRILALGACFGLLMTLLVIALGGMLAFIGATIAFVAADVPIQLLFSGIFALAFVYSWFGANDWQSCSAVALDVPADRFASWPVSKLRLIILSPFVVLLFFILSLAMPVLGFLGEAQSLPRIGIWLAALFLAVGWFAALETLPFVAGLQQPPRALMPTGGGHRQFRAPTQRV